MRTRLTAGLTLAIAGLMLVVCFLTIGLAKHAAYQEADMQLRQVEVAIKRDLSQNDEDRITTYKALLAEEGDLLHANNLALVMLDRQGHVVARSQQAVPSWPLRGDAWRVLALHLDGATAFKNQTMVLGLPWKRREHEFRQQAAMLLGVSLCVILAAARGAWVLVGRTLAPIHLLAQQAQTAQGSLGHNLRLTAPSQDTEVIALVTTLNGLLSGLTAMAASKGRFYAAASHELRTPLQALSGHLEVALSRPRTGVEYHAALAEAHLQTRRLTGLVQALLTLNQLDAAPTSAPCEPVNLAAACERALIYLRDEARHRELCLKPQLSDVTILAPSPHVHILLRNLFENAVKYATPGGEVRAQLMETQTAVTLEIFNECRPDPAWEPARCFEPFYRPDASRNARTGGNGLGLAICKAVADANGWHLELKQEPDGVRCVVIFPQQS